MPDSGALAASYAHCQKIARSAARNFYYGFRLLPPPKHAALCALYAFMRWVDDISDAAGDPGAKQRGLDAAREVLRLALGGDYRGNLILPAFHHTLETYRIPPRYISELIAGAEMDLTIDTYATFDDLRVYCYRVAGTVGQCCVHVFGAHDAHALDLAERLGLAFQLTNILRDLAQDFIAGRVYLPQEDFARFGCRSNDLLVPPTPALGEMLRFEAERARRFYREGAELLKIIPEDSRAALWALGRIYSGILDKIEARAYDVQSSRVRLSAAEKSRILVQARCGWWTAENGFEKRSGDRRGTRRAVLGRRAG